MKATTKYQRDAAIVEAAFPNLFQAIVFDEKRPDEIASDMALAALDARILGWKLSYTTDEPHLSEARRATFEACTFPEQTSGELRSAIDDIESRLEYAYEKGRQHHIDRLQLVLDGLWRRLENLENWLNMS